MRLIANEWVTGWASELIQLEADTLMNGSVKYGTDQKAVDNENGWASENHWLNNLMF
jgi:hypothetical protein